LFTARTTRAAAPEPAPAEDKKITADDPIHDELRAVRDGLVAAVNTGDVEGILKYCHPNIRLTTPDAVVSKGIDGVRSYYESKTKGPNRAVDSFSTKPTVDDLSSLYGGATAVATGTSVDHFKLTNGMEFDLNARWSATLVKENGKWLIADYHTATNVFDNPLLNATTKSIFWVGGICLLIGILISLLLTWVFRRRAPQLVK
jgi:ketosteroid isomerase-like protein